MNNLLKTSLGCLFIALGLNTAFTLAQDTMQTEIPYVEPPWLQVNCNSPSRYYPRMNPRWTVILTSKKPTVKQIAGDRWEISFTP